MTLLYTLKLKIYNLYIIILGFCILVFYMFFFSDLRIHLSETEASKMSELNPEKMKVSPREGVGGEFIRFAGCGEENKVISVRGRNKRKTRNFNQSPSFLMRKKIIFRLTHKSIYFKNFGPGGIKIFNCRTIYTSAHRC